MKGGPHPFTGIEPMEAKLVDALPSDAGWQYEPKWDGFRAIASRSGGHVELMSKSGKSLARYFPEIVVALLGTEADDYVVDGELILPIDGVLSFDALQARLHPAESRIKRLSAETPAHLMLFDCLAVGGDLLIDRPLAERRKALELFHAAEGTATILLSPHAPDLAGAQAWLAASGGALDGVIAKPLGGPYRAGERAMLKVKQHRAADCVVGGFRRTKDGKLVASLLLGLYDDAGLLNHVGFTSALAKQDRTELTKRLEALISAPGFTGKAPGGPSRWNDGKESEWFPLKPELVVEVSYDQVTSERLRHGAGLVRWRPDKAVGQCRMEQLAYALRPSDLADVS
ncbi:ATP-dependent DNA ligase [Sphingomonas sp. TX0543]|uniref:ATP-dependent DNA ligase n=1 Tax=Sphingomonas sp. TX0543 TaxID=3399682 RepID=UPI003AFB7DCB